MTIQWPTHATFCLRTALLFGILYLAFQAFPFIFGKHGFGLEQTGMAFIGIGVGMISGCTINICLILCVGIHLLCIMTTAHSVCMATGTSRSARRAADRR